jgi:membrane protease YdiL (CAAX protease family)
MKTEVPSPPGFWRTVRLLLEAARKRAAGRRKRQQELLRERSGRKATDWGALGFVLAVLVMLFLNGAAAFVVRAAVAAGGRIDAERQGKIVVSSRFLQRVRTLSDSAGSDREPSDNYYSYEARRIANEYGGAQHAIEQKLRDAVRDHGDRDFIGDDDASLELRALVTGGMFPAMLGSVIFLWWGVMLVFQGEGLELDLQRRRHPMWEWLFSHPVPAGAVFFADMLSPIAANPIYWGGPLFAGFLYGLVYGPEAGFLALIVIGVPITVAAACLGKAVEIGVVLRFPPRSRGAMVGLMSWMGYTSMMLFFVGLFVLPKVVGAIWKFLAFFTVLPWPWLRLFLGGHADRSFSFLSGMLTCWAGSAIIIAGAVCSSVWGSQQGLSGNLGRTDLRPSVRVKGGTRFGRDPLYRKEFLWFIRDRSAIVQTILIPLTAASYQLFNLRALLSHAQDAWNYLAGGAILFGTYFLLILGPRSLSSEGTALWIALTWPRGMESLLKAKAWLWSLISSGLVVLVLGYAAFLYPASIWKIALVGIGWFLFSRSMAEKTVTLVTVASESGEAQKIPWGRRWAAQLGMLTFSIGVLTQQWQLAIVGIVYSYMTAAAMWENFRARLPYLYDPWSERLPPPPTLMHAMIAISILVEGGAVITGILIGFTGREYLAVARAISYGICAVAVSIGVSNFLGERGVSTRDIWRWPLAIGAQEKLEAWWRGDGSRRMKFLLMLLLGAAGGLALGLFAKGYLAVLEHFPGATEIIRKSREQMISMPGLRWSYAAMAVAFAPFAEEYLFRGLLFRALDREWGGWRAVLGSAAFFAVYHPPLSWLPVGLLAVTNALLFKKTGWLVPAVVLHTVYNAIVLG